MGIRRLTLTLTALTRAIRVARGNDVACREAGDTKSTLIAASWPSYTLLSMVQSNDGGHGAMSYQQIHSRPALFISVKFNIVFLFSAFY